MLNPNLPTLSSDLIYQLAQLIQQSQTASSTCQFEPHQPPKQTYNTEIKPTGNLLASHPILECLDVKRMSQKCNTLLKRLTMEQLEEFNEIIDQSLCDPINDNQIPKVLEATLKNIIKVDNNKGTEEIIHLPSHI
ncbi:hypothetical protein C2G38_2243232 [Gigaspora rosea]|uniref:Uncharacterized protein n=1 Tax=Gigaspora rosea TaxID=44941 RepID=A0A397VNK4_9GLOM|nr:hypothetical protein C2G38_2243232 [Gigaspora rosea]